jgi:prevent-host-death family protein
VKKRVFNVAEAKARFSSLVQRARGGEEIVIAKDNHPVAKLVSVSAPRTARTPGSAKGRVKISPDFNRTPSDFDPYT